MLLKLNSSNFFTDLERSIGLLNITGEVDPFSSELIAQFMSHIGYPKKHHLIGLHRMETDAPVIHTNSTTKLGTKHFKYEK